jgi:hypothetical protein
MKHRAEEDFIDIITFHEPELNLQTNFDMDDTKLLREERLWISRSNNAYLNNTLIQRSLISIVQNS